MIAVLLYVGIVVVLVLLAWLWLLGERRYYTDDDIDHGWGCCRRPWCC